MTGQGAEFRRTAEICLVRVKRAILESWRRLGVNSAAEVGDVVQEGAIDEDRIGIVDAVYGAALAACHVAVAKGEVIENAVAILAVLENYGATTRLGINDRSLRSRRRGDVNRDIRDQAAAIDPCRVVSIDARRAGVDKNDVLRGPGRDISLLRRAVEFDVACFVVLAVAVGIHPHRVTGRKSRNAIVVDIHRRTKVAGGHSTFRRLRTNQIRVVGSVIHEVACQVFTRSNLDNLASVRCRQSTGNRLEW